MRNYHVHVYKTTTKVWCDVKASSKEEALKKALRKAKTEKKWYSTDDKRVAIIIEDKNHYKKWKK